VLPFASLEQILERVRSGFVVDADAEVTMEANPGTVDLKTLVGLHRLGVTRLSLGVQSFSADELQVLGRIHDSSQTLTAFFSARQAGFDNINLDLIFGLPNQTTATWQATLAQALALRPEHLSLYCLSVEDGTPLANSIARGECCEPDPDLAAEMYELARHELGTAGYLHYEISNWARAPEYRCQHNLIYWRNEPYLGLGAGAHSWLGGRRWANVSAPAGYVARLAGGLHPLETEETIDPALEMGETMMMGLRLVNEGIEFERFQERFGEDLRDRFQTELADLAELGLIAIDQQRVRLTPRGQLLGNQVFLQFLPG
jgi:oxygen-independent coproporphyrinogen-3 oxidase